MPRWQASGTPGVVGAPLAVHGSPTGSPAGWRQLSGQPAASSPVCLQRSSGATSPPKVQGAHTALPVVSSRLANQRPLRQPSEMSWIVFGMMLLLFPAGYASVQQRSMSAMAGDVQMQMLMNATSTTVPAVPDSCLSDPTQANCTDYAYPHANAAADLASLCKAMPFMVACSVAAACNETGATAANISTADVNICEPFQLVATVCRPKENMMDMKGCTNYNTMCANNTQVQQCAKLPGNEALPTTKTVNDRVRSLCESMPHGDCDSCLPSWQKKQTWGECNLLDVYGSACAEMPEMRECAGFQKMCAKDASLWVCRKYPTAITEGKAAAASSNDTARTVTTNTTQQDSTAAAKSGAVAASVNTVLLLLSAVVFAVVF